MAKMSYDKDADLRLIQDKKVAVIGYGSQGHAHALNLQGSGVSVRVGLSATSRSRATAPAAGSAVGDPATVSNWADVIMVLVPDTDGGALVQGRDRAQPGARQDADVRPWVQHSFRHHRRPSGCRRHDGRAESAGHRVRELYVEGAGTPALIAIHQDSTGQAKALTLSYAKGIGVTRAGVIETTFAEETETDLFGEQSVLCGGVSALVKAGFETLVEAGYQPEIAYFECMHELKLIVDLMYQGGLNYMRYSVSDTAEHGDYTGGPRIVTDETRREMKRMLAEIRSGEYAEEIDRGARDRPAVVRRRAAGGTGASDRGGRRRAPRQLMPFLKPVTIPEEEQIGAGARKNG